MLATPFLRKEIDMSSVKDLMSKDHDRLDNIFLSFQKTKAGGLEQAKTLFSEFDSGLRRHIVWEEEILFPAFEEATGMKNSGPTGVMRMEHQQIKGFINQIREKLQKKDIETEEAEEGLIRVLTSHNQKEETILYPWIDRSLSENVRNDMIVKMENTALQ